MTLDGQRADPAARAVLLGYLLLAFAPFAVAATHSSFWERQHSTAPVAAVAFALVLMALVLRRRWAWQLLVVFEGIVLVSFVFDFTNALAFGSNLASFALLISPPMRRYVRLRSPLVRRSVMFWPY